jgi:hypothetical protein
MIRGSGRLFRRTRRPPVQDPAATAPAIGVALAEAAGAVPAEGAGAGPAEAAGAGCYCPFGGPR